MSTRDSLTSILHSKFGLPTSDLHGAVTFEELGFDSLALIELSLSIQKELGVRLDEGDLLPTQTTDEAATVIDTALRQTS